MHKKLSDCTSETDHMRELQNMKENKANSCSALDANRTKNRVARRNQRETLAFDNMIQAKMEMANAGLSNWRLWRKSKLWSRPRSFAVSYFSKVYKNW